MSIAIPKSRIMVSFLAALAVLFSFSATDYVLPKEEVFAADELFKGDTSITEKEATGNAQAKSLMEKIMGAAKIFAGFVLAISIFIIVYGGLKYMLAQGDTRQAETGKMMIIYAGIGIFVALSAFIIAKMFTGFA